MKRIVLIFLLVFFVSPVFAEEPLSFRDIKMGMTKDEVQSKIQQYDCFEKCCASEEDIKGKKVEIRYCFTENEGLLDHIFMNFAPGDYEDLKEALIEKFGKPKDIIERRVQNKMGAIFKNESVFWNFKRGDTVAISRYGSSIDKGFIVFASKEFNDKYEAKNKKAKTSPGF